MNKITATSGLVTTKVLKTNIWGVDVVGLVKKKEANYIAKISDVEKKNY